MLKFKMDFFRLYKTCEPRFFMVRAKTTFILDERIQQRLNKYELYLLEIKNYFSTFLDLIPNHRFLEYVCSLAIASLPYRNGPSNPTDFIQCADLLIC